MGKIKVALAGIGNCASALLQGIEFYKNNPENTVGLMHPELAGYRPEDIEVVTAFDVDERKVGRDLEEALFAEPNCTQVFWKNIPDYQVKVEMAPVLDGVSPHMKEYDASRAFIVKEAKPCDVVKVLKDSGAEMLINYLPVGSEEGARFYAEACLEAGIGFINAMPVFIASDAQWEKRFRQRKIPIIGDDVKSQLGATIIHRVLTNLFERRGVKLENTYQLNFGGNTDFLNMLNHQRLVSKKKSKTQSVQSQLAAPLSPGNIHIGPSDYIRWLDDQKICYIHMNGLGFGQVPLTVELKLAVEDAPNSGGVMLDAVRCMKLALDRGIGGVLTSISAYTMKSPPVQYTDGEAAQMVEEFIVGKREH